MLNQEEEPPSMELESSGEDVLVLRRGAEIVMKPLGKGEHAFLEKLHGGAMLSPALDAALDLAAEFDLESALKEHIAMGSFAAIDT